MKGDIVQKKTESKKKNVSFILTNGEIWLQNKYVKDITTMKGFGNIELDRLAIF